MLISKDSPAGAASPFAPILAAASHVILGKDHELRLAAACLLAGGHLLIEDLPGLGKTTLAHTLARLLGLQFSRVQFTADLLPADVTGVSIFERRHEPGASEFRFLPGPIFTQVLLADEINRATPTTQSALLEAMAEGQVSVDGESRALPQPFFVIATQNPASQIGTFALPESQLDRFLMRLTLGYPDRQAERALLAGDGGRERSETLTPLIEPAQLLAWQAEVCQVHASAPLIDYLQALLAASRQGAAWRHGLSPRAGLALLAAARAWAWLSGRNMVLPDDVQAVFIAVAQHRLLSTSNGQPASSSEIASLLSSVAIP